MKKRKIVIGAYLLAVVNVFALPCLVSYWDELCGGAFDATPATMCIGKTCGGSIDNHCSPRPYDVNVNDCQPFGVNESACYTYYMQWDPISNTCVGDQVRDPESYDVVLCHAVELTGCEGEG
ncbi:MAG: hypothetical protein WCH09_05645 [Bacteroidota bacterium]